MRVHAKSIGMNLGRGTEGKSASTLQGTSDQLGENTGKKRSTEATPAFSGSKFANINKGVITKLQLLQTKYIKTWNFSLSKMLIEQMHNNLVCPHTSKYLHHIHLSKVRSLWNFFLKVFSWAMLNRLRNIFTATPKLEQQFLCYLYYKQHSTASRRWYPSSHTATLHPTLHIQCSFLFILFPQTPFIKGEEQIYSYFHILHLTQLVSHPPMKILAMCLETLGAPKQRISRLLLTGNATSITTGRCITKMYSTFILEQNQKQNNQENKG